MKTSTALKPANSLNQTSGMNVLSVKKGVATMAAAIAGLMCLSMPASATNHSLDSALQNGDFSLDTRLFYFNRSFDAPNVDNADALTFGGIMKYTSGDFQGTKLGLGYYGNFSLFDIIDRVNDNGGNGTSILQSNGDDISFLGEAYLQTTFGNTAVTLGRQRLSTPLMNAHDLRALPTTYEAITLKNNALKNTSLEFGYVRSYTGFGAKLSEFTHNEAVWGEDGLAYVYGKTKMGAADVRAQYIHALEDSGAIGGYGYVDGKIPLSVGEKSYLKGQIGMTNHADTGNTDDSLMLGLKGGTSFGPLDVALLFNTIQDNTFKAVEAGPMYSDWQQGYGNYEPSDAFGIQAIYHPNNKASIKLGYVDVNVDSDGGIYTTDDFAEFNLDAKYSITDYSKVRLRYSMKDQTDSSTREDRDDFRIIYYHTFR